MTSAQEELMRRHGTPAEFEAACWDAYARLWITHAEVLAGVAKYKLEWEEASEHDDVRTSVGKH